MEDWQRVSHASKTKWTHDIADREIGMIIGPRGSRINHIRQTSGASVTVTPDEYSGGAQICITGKPAQVEAAQAMVCAALGMDADVGVADSAQAQRLEDPTTQEVQEPPAMVPVITLFWVPTDSLPYLIGKGGRVISHIRLHSSCQKIHICDEDNHHGAHPITTVQIHGSESAVATAIKMIKEVVQQHEAAAELWNAGQSLAGSELAAQGATPGDDDLDLDDDLDVYADYRDCADDRGYVDEVHADDRGLEGKAEGGSRGTTPSEPHEQIVLGNLI